TSDQVICLLSGCLVFQAHRFRLSQTLSHVSRLHWIVVEDGEATVPAVSRILQRSGVPHIYLATTSSTGMPRRGWTHRNVALQYVRENYDKNRSAVLYFADDDNTYDIRLFNDYIRKVMRIGVWAVGLVGGAWVEAPHVSSKGKVIAWDVMFAPGRPFATDMAGFAINIRELFRARDASFNQNCAKTYKQGPESCFLSQFGFRKGRS
ncbi:glycosyltransferase family 43, partial [Ostertagia ostertagi]